MIGLDSFDSAAVFAVQNELALDVSVVLDFGAAGFGEFLDESGLDFVLDGFALDEHVLDGLDFDEIALDEFVLGFVLDASTVAARVDLDEFGVPTAYFDVLADQSALESVSEVGATAANWDVVQSGDASEMYQQYEAAYAFHETEDALD